MLKLPIPERYLYFFLHIRPSWQFLVGRWSVVLIYVLVQMWTGEGRSDSAGSHAESHRASGRSVYAVRNAAAAGSASHTSACAPAAHHHPHSHHPPASPSRRSTRPSNLPGEVSSQISPVCKLVQPLVVVIISSLNKYCKVRCFLMTIFFQWPTFLYLMRNLCLLERSQKWLARFTSNFFSWQNIHQSAGQCLLILGPCKVARVLFLSSR